MTVAVLEAREVTRTFRRRGGDLRAVDGVSLDVHAGEIVGLVGPNGAGKTTLLRLISGMLAPDRGSIAVAGAPAGSLAARRTLGFAPDEPVFPPALTVREVLEYHARFHVPGAAPTAARRALVAAAIELGDLAEVAGGRAGALSLGYARRLALALAALGERRERGGMLLLDETLSAIDPIVRRRLSERLQRLAADGTAILLSSHDLAAVERLAARVVVLVRGRVARAAPLPVLLRERVLEIVLDGPPADVPPGFRASATGLEIELGAGTVEAALAVCRAHRLAVRATRVRLRSLEDVVVEAVDDEPR